ncbi:hypothetical protein [Streptomyces sp. x-80]|uniref:hypothetical protein n=1 Tax=Streptomyces sp. x-80 TaxID=2789282 RepID=UPI003980CC26
MPRKCTPPEPQLDSHANRLSVLIGAGAFWRLAPEWVPRTGYAMATRGVLKGVEAGLQRRLTDE